MTFRNSILIGMGSYMEWDKKLESGIPVIDSQHKLIIKKTGELLTACKNGVGKEEALDMLEFLKDYVGKHFAMEEKHMRECEYPLYLSHAREHRELGSMVNEFSDKIESEGVTSDAVVKINKMLIFWLIEHIMKTDLKMCEYLRINNIEFAASA